MTFTGATHTVNDVLSHVKRQFGDEAAVQITNEDIIRWVNQGQAEIFDRAEPIKASIQTDLVAQQAVYTLPADVSRVQAIYANGFPVKYMSTQEAEEYILKHDPSSTVNAQPEIWYEWGGSFTFYPAPDYNVVNGITMNYVTKATPVVGNTDLLSIPDPYYNRLLEYVLQQAYELDENFTAAQMKSEQFSNNLDGQQARGNTTYNTYPTITVLDDDL